MKKISKILNKLLSKLNKKSDQILEQVTELNYIKTTSKQVIALNLKFKNIENGINEKIEPQNEEEIYITFLGYLEKEVKGDVLPTAKKIENDLNISSRQRKELSKRAYDEDVLIKKRDNLYIYNINRD